MLKSLGQISLLAWCQPPRTFNQVFFAKIVLRQNAVRRRIVRIVAVHKVVARAPHDRVVARTAVHRIVPLVTAQRVGARPAVEEIAVSAAGEPIIPGAGENRVAARIAKELVIPSPAGDEVAAPARMDQVVVVADGRGEPAGIRRGPGVIPLFIEERGVDRLEDGVAVQVGAHLHEVIHFLKLRARGTTEVRDDVRGIRQRDAELAVGEVFYRQRAVDGQVVARDAIPLVGELIVQALVVRLAALLDPTRHQVLVIDDGALPIAAIPTRYGIRRVVHDDVMAITRVIGVQVLPRPSPQHIIAFATDQDVVGFLAEDQILVLSTGYLIASISDNRIFRSSQAWRCHKFLNKVLARFSYQSPYSIITQPVALAIKISNDNPVIDSIAK